MKKLLLIALCLTTISVHADDALESFYQHRHQREVEENQKDMLDEMKIERQMEWAHNLEQEHQTW